MRKLMKCERPFNLSTEQQTTLRSVLPNAVKWGNLKAKKYRFASMDPDELSSRVHIATARAVANFDPTRGVQLNTLVLRYVENAVKRCRTGEWDKENRRKARGFREVAVAYTDGSQVDPADPRPQEWETMEREEYLASIRREFRSLYPETPSIVRAVLESILAGEPRTHFVKRTGMDPERYRSIRQTIVIKHRRVTGGV